MSRVEEIAAGLSVLGRAVVSRTPTMEPAPAYMIASGNITSAMVSNFIKADRLLFARFRSRNGQRLEYRLTPLGQQVREHLARHAAEEGRGEAR